MTAPPPATPGNPDLALHRARPHAAQEGFPVTLPLWRRFLPHTAAAAALLLLVSAVAVPPVRAMAAQWLSVFRTEKIATVQLPDDQLFGTARMAGARLSLATARQFGEVSGPAQLPQPAPVSLAEAAAIAGGLHQPRLPSGIDPNPVQVYGLRSAEYLVKPDVDRINAWLQGQNIPARLSDKLKGQTVRVTTPGVALRLWGTAEEPRFLLAEGTSLQVTGTAALDLQQLVDVLAAIAGVPAEVTEQLKAIPDLQHTLVLPIGASTGEPVRVNGVRGVYYAHPDIPLTALVWTSDGKVYVAAGPGLSRQALIEAVSW